jgi:hypothetical protein
MKKDLLWTVTKLGQRIPDGIFAAPQAFSRTLYCAEKSDVVGSDLTPKFVRFGV